MIYQLKRSLTNVGFQIIMKLRYLINLKIIR